MKAFLPLTHYLRPLTQGHEVGLKNYPTFRHSMAISSGLSLKMRRLSFFSTLTVVWVHAFNLDDRYLWPGYKVEFFDWNAFFQLWVASSLFRFAIPLFFFISGYLMAEREGRLSYPEMLRKRARSLLVPYLAWSLIGLAITFWWEADQQLNPFVVSAQLRPFGSLPLHAYSLQQWLMAWLLHPVSFQLWFLRALFLYSALYPLLAKAVVRYPGWYFGVTGVLWLISSGFFLLDSDGLLFFALGIWIQKRGFQIEEIKLPFSFARLASVFILISVGKTLLAFTSSEWTILPAMLLHKFHQPLLILLVWKGYDLLPKVNPGHWFDRFSTTNFFIYGAHVPLVYYVTDWFFFTFGREALNRMLLFCGLPLLFIIFSGLLALVLRRFIPLLFKILSGWRNYPSFSPPFLKSRF